MRALASAICIAEVVSVQWEVVNLNAVAGSHLHDVGVWSPGVTASLEACQALCAQNVTCLACDWAGDADLKSSGCPWKRTCYFRSDDFWSPHANGRCNHSAARKVVDPVPSPSPAPSPAPSPQCPYVACTDDSDCSSATCAWCSSPKPGKGNNQTCSGPPAADDCNVLPGPNATAKLQYASWGDSVSKGIFGSLKKRLVDYEVFHPSSSVGGGCGNVVRGKYCADFWLHGAGGSEHPVRQKWDLLTFNFGLHDMAGDAEHVPVKAYKRNLHNISLQLLDATQDGRLFWLSSTPVPNVPLAPPRPQGDVAVYNAAAKEVMEELGIPIVDLYSFVIERCGGHENYTSCSGFQKQNNVHFEKAGYDAMADFIYATIRKTVVLV